MSYAQRKQLSGNPVTSVVLTVLVVGSLLYVIFTGLAYNVIKHQVQHLKTFDVEQPPPPPEKPPPPPKEVPKVPPPPVTPPAIVQPPIQAPPTITTVVSPIIPPPAPIAPPAPPPPPPPHKVQSASPAHGDVRNLFANVDYPEAAKEAGATGTAQARLQISPDGRVSGCSLIRQTGNSALDNFVCRVLGRARFTPAKDSNGQPTSDTYTTPPIVFQLQD